MEKNLHILKSEEGYGWKTGRDASGVRTLSGVVGDLGLRIQFNDAGNLISCEREEIGDGDQEPWVDGPIEVEKSIRVREFALEDLPVALMGQPHEYVMFSNNAWEFDPTERSRYAVLINEWKERHRYVFHWGFEYWCDEEGHVTGRRPLIAGSQPGGVPRSA